MKATYLWPRFLGGGIMASTMCWYRSIIVVLVSVFILAGQAPAGDKVVIYGFDRDFPPMTYIKKGKPAGFEIALIKAALEGTGYELVLKPGTWQNIQKGLASGDVHLTSGMAVTPTRKKAYLFLYPAHYQLKVMVFVKPDSGIETVGDLKGKRVATQRGSLYHQLLKKMGGMKLILYDDEPQALAAFMADKAQACCISDLTAMHYIRKRRYKGLVALRRPLKVVGLHFVVSRTRPDLLNLLSKRLHHLRLSGFYRKLYFRWLHRGIKYAE